MWRGYFFQRFEREIHRHKTLLWIRRVEMNLDSVNGIFCNLLNEACLRPGFSYKQLKIIVLSIIHKRGSSNSILRLIFIIYLSTNLEEENMHKSVQLNALKKLHQTRKVPPLKQYFFEVREGYSVLLLTALLE